MGYGVTMPMRRYRCMSAEDRETLSLGLAHGHSLRTKASVLGRAPSTVSRESTRMVPGHWEGDLLKGARNGSAVGTLVERPTRLVLLARMDGMDATSAREGFTKKLRHVLAPLRKTLTYSQGKEMAEHERLAQRLAIQVFCPDPYSPWQRGTNENTNGLLLQSLPKGTDLSGHTQPS